MHNIGAYTITNKFEAHLRYHILELYTEYGTIILEII